MNRMPYGYRIKNPVKAKERTDWTKYFPVVTALLIFFGVLRLISYYYLFGVRIVPYLEFSEIITSFLDVSVVFIVTIIGFMMAPIIRREKVSRIDESAKPYQKYIHFIKGRYWKVFIVLLLITSLFFFLDRSHYPLIILTLIYLTFMGFVMPLILFTSRQKGHLLYNIKAFAAFFILFTITTFVIFHSLLSYIGVRYSKYNNKTIVVFEDRVFVPSDKMYYIGKTNNYLFIHFENSNTTSAYPMSTVKEIKHHVDWTRL